MIVEKPKFIIIDVDGIMTTGQIFVSAKGKEFKIFGAHDHDGLKLMTKHFKIFFITADSSGYKISKKRIVDQMKFKLFLVNENKRENFLKRKFGFKNIIYIGDGLYDANIIKKSAYGICAKNSRNECKKYANFVTQSKSAEGAILDAALHILKKFKIKYNV